MFDIEDVYMTVSQVVIMMHWIILLPRCQYRPYTTTTTTTTTNNNTIDKNKNKE